MKRDLHNLNLGFIQLKRNVHFDSIDHDCPKAPPRSECAPNHARAPIAQDSSKGNQRTRRSKHSTNRMWRTRSSAHHKEIIAGHKHQKKNGAYYQNIPNMAEKNVTKQHAWFETVSAGFAAQLQSATHNISSALHFTDLPDFEHVQIISTLLHFQADF